ncbi:putative transcription factor TIFY family [Rosa chinensis]|uniref:Protein TIFY n=2 Tax=Rosa chinensis TaxID=74649 RepID=A0A2P6P1R7_ROSCH|nr:protein TIFY 6B isoform X1 [Rosa chinensis]PRQ15871.1 putative transcription factor TIFY family [Rosa chinensis]
MERDFLGLSSKKTCVTVKDEANDEPKNSVVTRSSNSGMQWSFSNKVSALPQFLSFTAPQEEMSRKGVHDTSSFTTISTADVFESSRKSSSGVIQKSFIHDKQAGNHYAMTVYPMQHPGANPIIPISLSTPVLQNNLFGQKNMVGSTIKPQPLAGVPILTPVSALPSKSSVVGTTDLRNASNSSGVPAQLTIFYAGTVNVYHDISPEKAQAIMLLAGNGSSPAHSKLPSTAQVQTPFPSPSTGDGFFRNQSHIASSISGLASPLSVTSHASSCPRGAFSSSNALTVSKPVATSVSSINHSEPLKVAAQSVMTNLIPAVPVPQARKASLARFFEKRKERMTSTLPYNLSKKSPDCSTPGSEGVTFSFNSSGSCPPQAIN